MNEKRTFSPLRVLFIGTLLALIAAALLLNMAKAQPFYTNTAGGGVHQYNDSLVSPLQPSKTLAEQLARGINVGRSVTTTDGTVTNTFSTNYTYSAAPCVVVQNVGTGISVTNDVVSVTTSNFVYKAGAPNITNNWIAIGQ